MTVDAAQTAAEARVELAGQLTSEQREHARETALSSIWWAANRRTIALGVELALGECRTPLCGHSVSSHEWGTSDEWPCQTPLCSCVHFT